MKHYVSPTGGLFAVEEDGSQDHALPAGCVLATDEQTHAIQNPVWEATTEELLLKLDSDNAPTQRNLRDFIMLTAAAIKSGQPVDLTQIPGIAKVVAVEAQAAALRAKL